MSVEIGQSSAVAAWLTIRTRAAAPGAASWSASPADKSTSQVGRQVGQQVHRFGGSDDDRGIAVFVVVERVAEFLEGVVVGGQVLQVVDDEQVAAAEFIAESEFGLAFDGIVEAVAEIGGRGVRGARFAELGLPVANETGGQVGFARAAGAEQDEQRGRESIGGVGCGGARLEQLRERSGDEVVLGAGDERGQGIARHRFAAAPSRARAHGRATEFR